MKKKLPVLLTLGATILVACGSKTATPISEGIPPEYEGLTNPFHVDAATEGGKVFQVNCEPCHGPQGHGDGPSGQALDPKPKNLAEFQKTVGDDYLFWRINTGIPGTAMVPWKRILTDEQIWQVVGFIRTLK